MFAYSLLQKIRPKEARNVERKKISRMIGCCTPYMIRGRHIKKISKTTVIKEQFYLFQAKLLQVTNKGYNNN